MVEQTHLKNSQIGHLPQIGVNIKNVWNHHPDVFFSGLGNLPFPETNSKSHPKNVWLEYDPFLLKFRPKNHFSPPNLRSFMILWLGNFHPTWPFVWEESDCTSHSCGGPRVSKAESLELSISNPTKCGTSVKRGEKCSHREFIRLLMAESLHQFRLAVYTIIFYIPGGCLGFLNHQQYGIIETTWCMTILTTATCGFPGPKPPQMGGTKGKKKQLENPTKTRCKSFKKKFYPKKSMLDVKCLFYMMQCMSEWNS